ncbi:hypothetical protein P5663_19180 [Priestia flexa]|nr:hypothetical protein [Priestia flexa]WEZ08119.1 hypothetical protein P5663_19180 [Priestia flexa]
MEKDNDKLFPGQQQGKVTVFINCLEKPEPIQLEFELEFKTK